jgi:hypothetical protein
MRTATLSSAGIPAPITRRQSLAVHLLRALAAVLDLLVSRRGPDTLPSPEWFKYPPF